MNRNNLILIIIIAILLLVIIAGIILYITVLSKAHIKEPVTIKIDENIISYAFEDPFINNVNNSNKMIKVSIEMELNKKNDKKLEEALPHKLAEMRDKINYIIRGKNEQDLMGPQGQETLKREILKAMRGILGEEKVVNIYFSEFIVQ